ncbi:hypothetical protein DEU56DRAFT_936198 [Suillus clintonianus]|uniref:uncharacterized protein n=1 Tax=Suillus clintonianus TaxID=1904413 RepID=UPI001B86D3AC|nr:uncharacterized protein DEU56DRAFT_936198 [Suillus clintonianus]KAG2111110.1 hypothetical protein DEU56DRAFT_936198 [Suillus clintonianus]
MYMDRQVPITAKCSLTCPCRNAPFGDAGTTPVQLNHGEELPSELPWTQTTPPTLGLARESSAQVSLRLMQYAPPLVVLTLASCAHPRAPTSNHKDAAKGPNVPEHARLGEHSPGAEQNWPIGLSAIATPAITATYTIIVRGLRSELIESTAGTRPRIYTTCQHARSNDPFCLRAACAFLDLLSCSYIQQDFWDAVLIAVYPTQHSKYDDLLTNAIQLLDYAEWPNDSHLAGSPLPSIQRLVLLALPAPSLDNPPQYIRYCHVLIGYMGSDKRNDCRHSALLRAYDLRDHLAKIIAGGVDTPLRDMVLSELSPALLTAVHPDTFDADHDIYYLCLVFALANTPDWLPHLDKDGHIGRCIRTIPDSWDQPHESHFYLAGIFLRIQLARPEHVAPQLVTITSKQWWNLMRMAWHFVSDDTLSSADFSKFLDALVTRTKTYISHCISKHELQSLLKDLDSVKLSRILSDKEESAMEETMMKTTIAPAAQEYRLTTNANKELARANIGWVEVITSWEKHVRFRRYSVDLAVRLYYYHYIPYVVSTWKGHGVSTLSDADFGNMADVWPDMESLSLKSVGSERQREPTFHSRQQGACAKKG